MSVKIHGEVRGKDITKPCPVCGGRMEKCDNGISVLWQCRNDDCAHQEQP
jgi:hypothetical protein